MLLLTAVSVTAWCGGFWPAMVATALAAVGAAIFIFPPLGRLDIFSVEDMVRLGMFIAVALIISSMYEARARAEQTAEAGRTRLLYALEKARMGIWEMNLKSGEVWWSPDMAELLGESEERFAHNFESFIGRIHPDDQDFVKHAITRPGEGGTDFEIDHRILRSDGAVRRVKLRGRIMRDENGQATQVLAAVVELDEAVPAEPAAAFGAGRIAMAPEHLTVIY